MSLYENSYKAREREKKKQLLNLKTVDRTWRNIFMQCDINQIWKETNWRKKLEDEVLIYRTYVHTQFYFVNRVMQHLARNVLLFLPFEKVRLASHSLLRVSIWNFRRWMIHSFLTSHAHMRSFWMLPFSWACANSPAHFILFICEEFHFWKLTVNKLIQTTKRKEKQLRRIWIWIWKLFVIYDTGGRCRLISRQSLKQAIKAKPLNVMAFTVKYPPIVERTISKTCCSRNSR